GEQRRHRHDHAALAVAALRHVIVDPGLLHFAELAVLRDALDRGDLLAGGVADLHRARPRRDAVDVNRAGAALPDAASVFCSGEPDLLADHPQQWGGRVDVYIM